MPGLRQDHVLHHQSPTVIASVSGDILMYAGLRYAGVGLTCFLLGLWICRLSHRRMLAEEVAEHLASGLSFALDAGLIQINTNRLEAAANE